MTSTPTLRRLLLGATTTLLLAACGGGGSSTPAPGTGNPDGNAGGPAPLADFAAMGSSARTVNLSWAPATTATTYTVERKAAGGSYLPVASVDGRNGQFLDDGLAKSTAYSYRVVAAGGGTVAEASVSTTDEDAVVTATGAPQGDAATQTVGAAGGRVATASGAIAVDVPAGAFAADTTLQLQPVGNTAPDGLGEALTLRLAARPAQPLRLTLRYDSAEDNNADAMRIAVQRSDGLWFSLPLAAVDKTTRTLQSELPLALLAPVSALKTAQDANVSLEFTVVRYLAFKLEPKAAQVEVKKTLTLVPYARVRGYDTQIGTCIERELGLTDCLMKPVLESREIPLLNSKAGFTREWNVLMIPGGNTTLGTVVPRSGSSGAVYTAPAQVPNPRSLLVSFESLHNASGRQLRLNSDVTIYDTRWQGTITAQTPVSSAGTSMLATGTVTWTLDAAASSGTTKVYRGSGDLQVQVSDDDCTVTVTPDRQPVGTDPQFVQLVVDESAVPARYTLTLVTFWPATIAATCPKGSGYTTTMSAGYGWELQGRTSTGGNIIEGTDTGIDGEVLTWRFSR